MTLLRTFIALTLESQGRDQLCQLQRQLLQSLSAASSSLWRSMRREQLHLTVAFLGDTHPDQVPMVAAAVEQVAQRHRPFELSGDRILFLPKPRHAQVVALGFDDAKGEASALADEVARRLTALNFRLERRPFLPHLTLLRNRKALDCSSHPFRATSDDAQPVVLRLGQLAFFASFLEPSGARHELLSRTPLGSNP